MERYISAIYYMRVEFLVKHIPYFTLFWDSNVTHCNITPKNTFATVIIKKVSIISR